MASKRGLNEAGCAPHKKLKTQFEPVKIGPIYSLEELDIKVLQFQNKKLSERIDQRRRAEEELRRRIEQLEQRQTTDDAVLCIVNRYWNQLDEDVRILVQRFDADTADETGKKNESSAVTSFVTLLSQWDRQEIEEKLRQRVEFSKRAIGKLIQAYDRLAQRSDRLWNAIRQQDCPAAVAAATTEGDEKREAKRGAKREAKREGKDASDEKDDDSTEKKVEADVKKEPGSVKAEGGGDTGDKPAGTEEEDEEEGGDERKDALELREREEGKLGLERVSAALRDEMRLLMGENRRLQDLTTEVHQRSHEITLKNSELLDKLTAAETEIAELRNQVDELDYEHRIAGQQVHKLDRHLSEAIQRLKTYQEGEITVQGGGEGVSKNKFNEIVKELEDQRELATNRLTELEKIQKDQQDALKEIERLKMDLKTLPESVIVETTDYLCLKSQFSVLYNESMQMKTQLEDARSLLGNYKNTHLRQIEQMESDELACQKRLRTELIQLEDQFAQVRREYEMLRIEFEQTLAANEQTGPINREMRNLISSLKNHNEQLKGEISRSKSKLKEAGAEISKLHELQKGLWRRLTALQQRSAPPHRTPPKSDVATPQLRSEGREHAALATAASDHAPASSAQPSLHAERVLSPPGRGGDGSRRGGEEEERATERERERGKADSDAIRELKLELKKSQDRDRDMKLLLDMHKCVPKEARDKAQLMCAERKAKQELEELRGQMRRLQESERKERRKLAEDDALRKIKKYEDLIGELQRSLAAQKQEEEALLNEMEVTGQAFEDMQEQNIRLLQQLREKDDANFKLMSERIKSNQIHKLLREEKDVLVEQVGTLQTQVAAQNQVVRKLEEKENILQNNLSTVEKELGCRQQAAESYKRKAVEGSQSAADLKLHLDKYQTQLKEAQMAVGEKTGALQQETYKYKRIQEEVASLRKTLERVKKIEQASSADEVVMEEIREYKEQLTCPSCKVKKKDAVLTKCFHVFCLDCLKTRYETRQRKCPKCNATFGANDFHRIYLE